MLLTKQFTLLLRSLKNARRKEIQWVAITFRVIYALAMICKFHNFVSPPIKGRLDRCSRMTSI